MLSSFVRDALVFKTIPPEKVYVAPEWSQEPVTEPIVQDEHNRLGADGDICLPFDLDVPGYSEPSDESADIIARCPASLPLTAWQIST